MARTINRIELLGRVGTDPEMRYPDSGNAVTTFRVATDRRRQNGDTETDWHNVVCWGKQAEAVNTYVGKGDRIYVSGSLAQKSFEGDDGQRRHRTEVHAQEVVFLDSRNGERQAGENGHAATEDAAAQHAVAAGVDPFYRPTADMDAPRASSIAGRPRLVSHPIPTEGVPS